MNFLHKNSTLSSGDFFASETETEPLSSGRGSEARAEGVEVVVRRWQGAAGAAAVGAAVGAESGAAAGRGEHFYGSFREYFVGGAMFVGSIILGRVLGMFLCGGVLVGC